MNKVETVISNNSNLMLCLNFTVYWTGTTPRESHAISKIYETYITYFGSSVSYYRTGEMSIPRPVDSRSPQIIFDWLDRSERPDEFFSIELKSGAYPDALSGQEFAILSAPYRNDRVGAIRITVPADDSGSLATIANVVTRHLKLHSGHGGYAIHWDHLSNSAYLSRLAMGRLGPRFPGIDLADPFCSMMAIPFGIKRINWLTVLGDVAVEKMGGIDRLERRVCDDQIAIQTFDNAVLIRAGHSPGVGDVNRREHLNCYHKVGNFLAPIRSRRHPPFLASREGMIDEALSNRWLAHFD
jgi:hypothetical protein